MLGKPLPKPQTKPDSKPETEPVEPITTNSVEINSRLYRLSELRRIQASLLAGSAILVAGEEGSGKSYLVHAVTEQLLAEGFNVAVVEPATPKQMLKEIADQLGIEQESLEGKALSADQLKNAIASYFQANTAFLVIDGVQGCELKFRMWLKELKRQGVSMLLAATDPPRSDVFLNLPRIELKPLSEYAIRELMEQAALERGINLDNSTLAKLQARTGGNPMLAIRTVEEEYLGLENNEAGDHRRYFDMTPLILLVGVGFVVMRFIAVGTSNPTLYVLTGSAGALFMGASYAMRSLPKEDRKIR